MKRGGKEEERVLGRMVKGERIIRKVRREGEKRVMDGEMEVR